MTFDKYSFEEKAPLSGAFSCQQRRLCYVHMFARTDLAWAAGFVDGEGCFSRAGPTAHVTASQTQLESLNILWNVLGTGTLKGPCEKSTAAMKRKPQWIFYAYGDDVQAIYELIDPWLGAYRRGQARKVLLLPEQPYEDTFTALPFRERIAWAGGFFDGEGCFASITETMTGRITHTDVQLLERFKSTVGFGKIYGPYAPHRTSFGKKPVYVYSTTGFERVQALLAVLWPNLGSAKRTKAISLLKSHLTFWRCGHRRGRRWQRHCPICFKPGPKPGFRQAKSSDPATELTRN
jgi:hypothetical protein